MFSVKSVVSLQQSCTEFLDTWGFLCASDVDVVDRGLKECVETTKSLIIVEAEDVVSFEQLIHCSHRCQGTAWNSLVVEGNVEPLDLIPLLPNTEEDGLSSISSHRIPSGRKESRKTFSFL